MDDIEYGREVIRHEANAVAALEERIDASFATAVQMVLDCRGRVVVSGMGKPAIIAQKISATFASTGTPSHWLHAAEAIHGDLGRVLPEDVVIVISNSGETREVTDLLDPLKKIGASSIAITGRPDSTLGRHADVVLDIGKIDEACPLGLAPSASTTAMLAIGDALAMTVLNRRDFGPEEYAVFHPGGSLGRKLMKVSEVMRTGDRHPTVPLTASVHDALLAIIDARAGAVTVVDGEGRLAGIFTDGDLRRLVAKPADGAAPDLHAVQVGAIMTRAPTTITADRLASEAMRLLREKKIDELPVVDADGRAAGMIDVQDLLDTGHA